MKKVFLLFFLLASVAAKSQQTTVQGDIVRVRQQFFIKSQQITDISTDTIFAAASNLKLSTQLAIKKYADSRLAGRSLLQNAPVSGQIVRWNGVAWGPSTETREIVDFIGASDIAPALSPASYTGQTWRNSVGELYYSNGLAWLTDNEVLISSTQLQGAAAGRFKIGIDTVGVDTLYIANAGTFRRFVAKNILPVGTIGQTLYYDAVNKLIADNQIDNRSGFVSINAEFEANQRLVANNIGENITIKTDANTANDGLIYGGDGFFAISNREKTREFQSLNNGNFNFVGNVGSGLITPTSPFHIRSAANSYFTAEYDGLGSTDRPAKSGIKFNADSALSASIELDARYNSGIENSKLRFFATDTSGTLVNGMTFDGQGRLGVGVADPTEALDVTGNVKSSSWAGSDTRILRANSSGVSVAGGLVQISEIESFYGPSQTITSGSSSTISDSVSNMYINPASLLATHTITLPAAPQDQQTVEIVFGGTIAASAVVVTSLTISPNSGQSIYQAVAPITANGGDAIRYKYNDRTTTWYKIVL